MAEPEADRPGRAGPTPRLCRLWPQDPARALARRRACGAQPGAELRGRLGSVVSGGRRLQRRRHGRARLVAAQGGARSRRGVDLRVWLPRRRVAPRADLRGGKCPGHRVCVGGRARAQSRGRRMDPGSKATKRARTAGAGNRRGASAARRRRRASWPPWIRSRPLSGSGRAAGPAAIARPSIPASYCKRSAASLYDSDAFNDDLPYFTQVKGQPWLVIPYSVVHNDARFVIPSGPFRC